MKLYRAALVLALVFPLGCHLPTAPDPPPAPVTIVINNNQNQGSHNTTMPEGMNTTPVPGGAVVAVSVRVGIFTATCPDGGPVPENAQNAIRLGCTAKLTATPKDANNQDLVGLPESAFQAMAVSWSVSGGSCTDLGDDGNKFNRQVKGAAVGTCSVCATVNGLIGCARQPTGEQLVRVQ